VDEDFSECHDLAEKHPEKLRGLVEQWWADAGAFDVLPLDDRDYERVAADIAARRRTTYVYYPGMARIDRLSAPDIADRSYSIAAEVEVPSTGAEGVLLASGTRFAGYVLYVKDRRLVYEYVYSENTRYTIRCEVPVPTGRSVLRYEFAKTGPRRGRGTLSIDGRPVGSAEIPKTWPVYAVSGGILCGRDGGSPVSDAYGCPFAFTGTIHRVVVELGADGKIDARGEHRAALAEE